MYGAHCDRAFIKAPAVSLHCRQPDKSAGRGKCLWWIQYSGRHTTRLDSMSLLTLSSGRRIIQKSLNSESAHTTPELYQRTWSSRRDISWSPSVILAYQSRRRAHLGSYLHLKNGSYVPDNSMNFRHGDTEVLDLHQARHALIFLLRSCHPQDLVLIFHDARADLSILRDLSIEVPAGALVADTRAMFADLTELAGVAKGQFVSLGKLLDHFDILEFHLHNAGNDAHGTLMAYMKMS